MAARKMSQAAINRQISRESNTPGQRARGRARAMSRAGFMSSAGSAAAPKGRRIASNAARIRAFVSGAAVPSGH